VVDISLRSTSDGAYIDRTFGRLVGRSATDAEITRWYETVRSGARLSLTSQLVTSDHIVGKLVDDLYQRALGRAADPDGRAYWVSQLSHGTKLEQIGVLFFGSPEYFLRGGGNSEGFVAALYRDVLGRQADAEGAAYWQDRLASHGAGLDDVAAGFYVSLESRRARASAVSAQVFGSTPTGTVDALADRLLSVGDLTLAAEIAASAGA
jgi:hypothetical protein